MFYTAQVGLCNGQLHLQQDRALSACTLKFSKGQPFQRARLKDFMPTKYKATRHIRVCPMCRDIRYMSSMIVYSNVGYMNCALVCVSV